jgi:hypothetical protein
MLLCEYPPAGGVFASEIGEELQVKYRQPYSLDVDVADSYESPVLHQSVTLPW